ncbi:DNA polymerase III subunit delta [Patescibacteria group bacterium]|nr:DNA polymerase III subunit delta [Patescibacteria group bacterium]
MEQIKHVVLISGNDTYSINELLKKWQKSFIEKNGDFNFDQLDGKRLTWEKILEIAEQVAFLGDKRMIYIANFLRDSHKDEQKKAADNIAKIPDTTLLIFAEDNAPDKRTSLYKKLTKNCRHEEFNNKTGASLTGWVNKEFTKLNAAASQEVCGYLPEIVGNDLWSLSNEIKKLADYSDGRAIEKKDIDLLCKVKVQASIFKFVDILAQKNFKKALEMFQDLVESGEELMFIFHMIVRQIRIITLAKTLLEKNTNSFQLSKMLKIPPFVIKNTISQANNFSTTQLKSLYALLLELEVGLKTGKIKISTTDQRDFAQALEKFIFAASK